MKKLVAFAVVAMVVYAVAAHFAKNNAVQVGNALAKHNAQIELVSK